ncbi:hypothetical protein [Actinotalea fermentans]|uniref:MinD-like ATPase involved in chromosome partitioning or flagellar assembly n=1 Tax=Actinotalea fermentans TaxID=43671 RepID=A0A511YUW3_9CELL|nr:hypothetical protein [Actinotalea fermentans]KGM17923.1 hypothetical protein N867_00285 [Actinotalea fermentans ATCC 43279 = JCM 9966 = DSM 3133]GEN78980.1 hypothetical protein AFE02nite_07140 [Actinotalea fermentans]
MAVLTLCSASGAPGVTTSAFALARVWHLATGRSALLVDADPVGSALIPAFAGAGIPTGGGVLAVAAERASSADDILRRSVALDDDAACLVLTGVTEPAQARPLGAVWTTLVEAAHEFDGLGIDVLVDAGRLGHGWEPQPLIDAADIAVLVTRTSLSSVALARPGLAELARRRPAGAPVRLLVVGRPAPYSSREVARALDGDALPEIPDDAAGAHALLLAEPPSGRLGRSGLLRAARQTAAGLAGAATTTRAGEVGVR